MHQRSTLILYRWHWVNADRTGFISISSITHHANSSLTQVVLFIHHTSSSILNNPSSSDIKDSVKALISLFVFMSGTVNHLLSAFEVHPHDKQAWLSTCAMICHPWFLYTETAWQKALHPRPKGRTEHWVQSCCSIGNVVVSFCAI